MDNNRPGDPDNKVEDRNDINAASGSDTIPEKSPGFSIDNRAIAIIGLILGFVLSSILGFVLGIIALVRMKKSGDKRGIGFAVASVSIHGLIIALGVYALIDFIFSGTAAGMIDALGEIFSFLISFIRAFFKGIFDFYFGKDIDKFQTDVIIFIK